MRRIYAVCAVAVIIFGLLAPGALFAQEDALRIHFFYSPTCPHCHAEQAFLDDLASEYPDLRISRYNIGNEKHHPLLFELAREHGAERYIGSVPMTFVGDDFFLGFDNEEGIGKEIEASVERQMKGSEGESDATHLPGGISTENYSLPALAVILGFLDGFNVCSVGALLLILGLVMTLKSRKKIVAIGGTFIVITAVMYGVLIVLWFKLFEFLAPFIRGMELIIGLLALAGGLYFLYQFTQYRKYGPTCQTAGNRFINAVYAKVDRAFQSQAGVLAIAGAVALFAGVVTIIEFPCSAAVPVVFAGILSNAGLSPLTYLLYIALFVLFYLLDELIVFGIAVWKMKTWMASHTFVTWATLAAGLIMLILGYFYIFGFT